MEGRNPSGGNINFPSSGEERMVSHLAVQALVPIVGR